MKIFMQHGSSVKAITTWLLLLHYTYTFELLIWVNIVKCTPGLVTTTLYKPWINWNDKISHEWVIFNFFITPIEAVSLLHRNRHLVGTIKHHTLWARLFINNSTTWTSSVNNNNQLYANTVFSATMYYTQYPQGSGGP